MKSATLHTTLPGDCAQLADWLANTALADLSPDHLSHLSQQYDAALARPNSLESEIAALLTRPFSQRLEIPEYYRYTWLHVIDWFLARQDDVFEGCLLALQAILTDLSSVERQQALRHPKVPELSAERIRRLEQVIDEVGATPIRQDGSLTGADVARRGYADERKARQLLILTRCSGFRRSDKFDEYIFIRSVQACELIFFMIRWLARQAIPLIDVDHGQVMLRMRQVAACAELLNTIFHALRTLTPELFMGFREETGDASAVQSLNYHLMELVIYGYDQRKVETYHAFDHLEIITDPRLHEFRALQDAAHSSRRPELAEAFTDAERRLLAWRGRHYGFGRTYLPNMKGSGGTEGAGYLKRFVKKTGLASGPDRDDPEQLLSRFAFR